MIRTERSRSACSTEAQATKLGDREARHATFRGYPATLLRVEKDEIESYMYTPDEGYIKFISTVYYPVIQWEE